MARHRATLAAAMLLLLGGCAGDPESATSTPTVNAGPPPGKAIVVFFRPALLDRAGEAPVFDISTEPQRLVGIITPGHKLAYASDPGPRRFMVVGEVADFLDAELVADRIYYARVAPARPGALPGFALHPVAPSDIVLAPELADCSWTAETDAWQRWARDNRASVARKEAASLPAWLARPNRPVLGAGDAR